MEWNGSAAINIMLLLGYEERRKESVAGGGLVELIRLFDHIKCNDRNANHKMKWMDRRGASRTGTQVTVVVAIHNRHE